MNNLPIESFLNNGSIFIKMASSVSSLEARGYGARCMKSLVRCSQGQSISVKCTIDVDAENEDAYKLVLMDEEALYLYLKKEIVVFNVEKKKWISSDVDLWSIFTSKNNRFAVKYKVYNHYKDARYLMKYEYV